MLTNDRVNSERKGSAHDEDGLLPNLVLQVRNLRLNFLHKHTHTYERTNIHTHARAYHTHIESHISKQLR